jgi:ethanolamine utilization protein EutN
MIRATVTGTVWATRRLSEIPNGAFLEVRAADSQTAFVAFDVLGSGIGEEVLVVQGSVASAWFGDSHPPVDALIIGSVDPQPSPSSSAASTPTSPDPAQPGPGEVRREPWPTTPSA